MNVNRCMKTNVVSISAHESVAQAVKLVIKHHIGTLPVVDLDGKLIGTVNLRVLLALIMPDAVNLLDNIDYLYDFGAFEQRRPSEEDLQREVQEIMEKPVCVKENSGLLHAAAMLSKNSLKDIPVVAEGGELVGLISHVDVGTALMESWKIV